MNTDNAPCPCVTMTRDASDHISPHHPACELRVSLWECENCGARAINGKGREWSTLPGDRRMHACPRLPSRLSPCPAVAIELAPAEQALVAMVRGFRVWAADTDGVHEHAWDAYVYACRVLGLPEPKEEP